MTNPRMTKKERGLLKGAGRRVFGRSELRRSIIDKAIVKGYSDSKRKAVKFWVKCEECGTMEAKSNCQVDHREPVVPLDKSADEMSFDDLFDRMWCKEDNLQIVCKPCHQLKTKAENKERRLLKKGKK